MQQMMQDLSLGSVGSSVTINHCLSSRNAASDSPCAHLQRVNPQCDIRQAKLIGCQLTLLTCFLNECADGLPVHPYASMKWRLKKMMLVFQPGGEGVVDVCVFKGQYRNAWPLLGLSGYQ